MFEQRQQVFDAVTNGFSSKPILVIGDLILDRYIWGNVNRISPESPVPVVHFTKENEVAGGAANVALNIACLGAKTSLSGYLGDDANGSSLVALVQDKGVDTEATQALPNWSTITKTRIVSGHQQMLRVDRESPPPINTHAENLFIEVITSKISSGVGLILLSDYDKGVLSDTVISRVIAIGRQAGIPILIDPKGNDYQKYKGATTLTPNRQELTIACNLPHNIDIDTLLKTARELRQRLSLNFLVVTLGSRGAVLIEEDGIHKIPARAQDVFDVSGAGDTVISVLAAGLIAGISRLDALHLANIAAGIVVGKVGTAPIQRKELLQALSMEQSLEQSQKICQLPDLMPMVEEWRARGEQIVFTNGCFDLLHAGHVTYLEKAKLLGQRLIVGLNSDASVKALKGPSRPVISENDRARVLAALSSVDAVVLFAEQTPLSLIKALRPDILAKGADYTEEQVVGVAEVKSWGGTVALVDMVDGKSSSLILRSIQSSIDRGTNGQADN